MVFGKIIIYTIKNLKFVIICGNYYIFGKTAARYMCQRISVSDYKIGRPPGSQIIKVPQIYTI